MGERENEVPTGCKMHAPSRYASDLDCKQCGLGEGDVCDEWRAASDERIKLKREAAATLPPNESPTASGEQLAERQWCLSCGTVTSNGTCDCTAGDSPEMQNLVNYADQLQREYTATDDLLAEAVEALEPFAAVFEQDIGDDENDGDLFRPMSSHNRAPRLTVGDLRRARATLTRIKESRNG